MQTERRGLRCREHFPSSFFSEQRIAWWGTIASVSTIAAMQAEDDIQVTLSLPNPVVVSV